MKYFELSLLAGVLLFSACSNDTVSVDDGNAVSHSTSLFVATDRHESGSGNNLAASLQMIVSNFDVVAPTTVLLGGDYVGGRYDMTPVFSVNDIKAEVFRSLDSNETDLLLTYGSHDQEAVEGYGAFFSGPKREEGYYIYGISYVQMAFATDSAVKAEIELYAEQQLETDSLEKSEMKIDISSGKPKLARGYNGIDTLDAFGRSAESATARFTAWVKTLKDHAPIVMMSHLPMHANREDNAGGKTWFKAIREAAKSHDIIFFYGHNHTLDEMGDTTEASRYLLVAGDSLKVQGEGSAKKYALNFTYANAGYLKLGWSTLLTFDDVDGDRRHDRVTLRRYSLFGADDQNFGSTDKENPYVLELKK